MNIENLLPELMLEIFSRLPVSSLPTIKRVCKNWYDLSSDPRLPHMHLAQSHAQKASILAYELQRERRKTPVCMTEHYTSVKPLFHFPQMCRVQHSLDGLLLADDYSHREAFVANPLTGEHLILPPTRNKTLWPSLTAHVRAHYGLGFDSSIKKYKVVCAYFWDIDFANKRWRTGAQVYTIGTTAPSSWVDIVSQPAVPIDFEKNNVYASGARHWMVNSLLGANHLDTMVIAFDFEKEEFKTIPCQGFFSVSHSEAFDLIDLSGCLGMVNLSLSTHIEIWKLMDYKRNQWVRVYSIDLLPDIKVVGLTEEDEIVLVRYYYAYNENAAVYAGDAGDAVVVRDAVYAETDLAAIVAGYNASHAGAADDAAAVGATEDAFVGDGFRRAVLLAYNSKTATLRNIHRFNNVQFANFFLHKFSLISLWK